MIKDYLYEWQNNILEKYKDRKRYGLFLDMGLGKTIISLAFAEHHKSQRILIVTLNSKAQEKVNDNGSWAYWLDKGNYKIAYKNFKELPKEDYGLIINYESLFKRNNLKSSVELNDKVKYFLADSLNKTTTIILDESHKVKSTSSQVSKAVNLIIKCLDDPYIYLLSGTPFTQGFIDLHNQLKILGYPLTKSQFIDNFCVRGNIYGLLEYQQPIVSYKNLDKLYELIHQYALTIKSEEVINLPLQSYVYLKIPKSKEFDLLTKENLKNDVINKELAKRGLESITGTKNIFYRNLDYPSLDWLCETVASLWLRARQISIGFQGNAEKYVWYNRDRLNKLKQFLTENEGNYVLFYNFTPEMYELYEVCESCGYNIDIYSGEIKSLIFYDKFSKQSEEERVINNKNIILSNFASGSTGMNWQLYNKCIIFSLPLYKDYEQSLKRIHRIGQKNNVIYYIFEGDNWLDNSMKEALNKNIEYSKEMFEKKLKENK